jgi:2-amino-4-hydroxy-6-hydroxymethyldihydropteridine diphosphokinase
MSRTFIGVGSNIQPALNVEKALLLLGGRARIVAISTMYRTSALGRPDQPPYYNGVVEIETELSPEVFKQRVLLEIEDKLGRKRSSDPYAARTIDLDLLLYDDLVRETGEIILPDPEIRRRPFLAIPLLELAPDLALPGTGEGIGEVAAQFTSADMTPLIRYTECLRKDILHGRERDKPGENPATGP